MKQQVGRMLLELYFGTLLGLSSIDVFFLVRIGYSGPMEASKRDGDCLLLKAQNFPPAFSAASSAASAVRSHRDGWLFAAKVAGAKQRNQARKLRVHDLDLKRNHSKGSFDILLMEKTPAPLAMYKTPQIMG